MKNRSDETAFLHDLGFDAVQRYNHDLVWRAAKLLTSRWGTTLGVKEEHVAFMVTLPLPEAFGNTPEAGTRLRDALLFDDRIEIQIHPSHGRLWARVSCQVYNDMADVERLAEAIEARARLL